VAKTGPEGFLRAVSSNPMPIRIEILLVKLELTSDEQFSSFEADIRKIAVPPYGKK
jgi:hypothetical protein